MTDPPRFVRFINGRIVRGANLVNDDLWVNTESGKVSKAPSVGVSSENIVVVDVTGKIIAPGFIDVQINGAFGFDFSGIDPNAELSVFEEGLRKTNKRLIQTGTTSYCPTMTSQFATTYHKILPSLGPTGAARSSEAGAESLGAHCEGPFFAHTQKGCHSPEAILSLGNTSGPQLVTSVYGENNLVSEVSNIKLVTLAPEREGALDTIRMLARSNIVASIGHTAATYEQAVLGVKAGARMVTHLFNAMNQLHHREPGIFGLIASARDRVFDERKDLADDGRPYFGIIADGIHLHPASVRLAYNAHPEGFVLITDAVMFMGCDDGTYDWTNGQRTVKNGTVLKLQGTETLAGSAVDILTCINNFIRWTGASIPQAIHTVTTNPASVLGLEGVKGCLTPNADADIVILETFDEEGFQRLKISEVWKFGRNVFTTSA